MKVKFINSGGLILLTCFIIQLFGYGIRHSFSVFFPYILDEYGWQRSDTAFIFSLHLLFYGLSSPVAGHLITIIKPKIMVLMGIFIICVSTFLCLFATNLIHFYILFGIFLPIGLSFMGSPIITPTIINWFPTKRGASIGIAQTGGGMSFFIAFLMIFVITTLGWRISYAVLSLATAAILFPLVFKYFSFAPRQSTPELVGNNLSGKRLTEESLSVWTIKSGLASRRLWFLFFSNMLFWGTGAYLVITHQVKLALDLGYSPEIAASTTAFFGIFMVVGQASSFISDYIGRETSVFISSLAASAGIICLFFFVNGDAALPLYLFSALFGYGSGLFAVCIYAGASDIFNGNRFGFFNGFILAGMGIGGAFGPWFGGLLHDIFHSYDYALILALISFIISSLFFYLAGPRLYSRLN